MSERALRPGDRVALLVPGSVRYVDVVISMLAAGIFPIPLDASLTTSERGRIVPHLKPHLTVTDQEAFDRLVDRFDDLGDPSRLPLGRPMHCTSGTTGTPKGVFSGRLSESDARALLDDERDLWGFRADDVNLVLSPLHHSAPLRFATGTLLAGGRVVAPGPFDPAAITAAIVSDRPTTMFCVPAHLQRLFDHWADAGAPDLSCFRLVAHAGAPCPDRVKRQLIELFPPGSTWEFYGATEGQFTACRSEEWLEHPGTLGRPRAGRRIHTDIDGTLWCTAPAYARFEYFGDPAKTSAAWRDGPDGPAFTVGDLGRVDDQGYVWLDGRREDLVITGGVNVYPAEVEGVLAEAPGVQDVAVFGVEDERWGQRVCAAYVGPAEPDALGAFARDRLAPAKRPKVYRRLDALPRTPTGKIRRLDLPELIDALPTGGS